MAQAEVRHEERPNAEGNIIMLINIKKEGEHFAINCGSIALILQFWQLCS